MSNNRKKIFKRVMKKSRPIFKAVLRSGADNIGKRLLNAVDDVNQPSDILLEKLIIALKSGALATGQEIVKGNFARR
jgi:hypothetical protein